MRRRCFPSSSAAASAPTQLTMAGALNAALRDAMAADDRVVVYGEDVGPLGGVPLHDYGCSLKAYRREVIQDVKLYGEMHRFIPIYASWAGARVTERAATAECVNALARQRGLTQLRVRGRTKVRCVLLLHALAHNLMRTVAPAPQLLGYGRGAFGQPVMAT